MTCHRKPYAHALTVEFDSHAKRIGIARPFEWAVWPAEAGAQPTLIGHEASRSAAIEAAKAQARHIGLPGIRIGGKDVPL